MSEKEQVRRRVPWRRRWKSLRGSLLRTTVWLFAAGVCAYLLTAVPGPGQSRGLAMSRPRVMLAPQSARVAQLHVTPMQRVEAGQVLAELEVPGLKQQITSKEAEIRSLEAEIAIADKDRVRRYQTDQEDARARYLSAEVSLRGELAVLTGLENELARLKAPGVAIASTVIEQKEAERASVAASVAARREEVVALQRIYDAARGRASDTSVAALSARIEVTRAELEVLKHQAEDLVIRAPVSGMVGVLLPSPGEWIPAGLVVLSVSEVSTQDAVVYVSAAESRRINPGDAVSLQSGDGRQLSGTVQVVGAMVEEVPVPQRPDPAVPEWGVPVTLKVGDGALMPGEPLNVDF